MIEDGSAVFKDHFLSGLSGETETLPNGSSSEAAAEAESEFKLRCDLCGKPQKGPSALREHYSITHFFEVKIIVRVLIYVTRSVFRSCSRSTWCLLRVTPSAGWTAVTRITGTGSASPDTSGQHTTRSDQNWLDLLTSSS